jgi:poly-gamma-glutamate synthesis protein (capsule biosynthesis protein)
MIFLGDIAITNGIIPNISSLPECFMKQPVVANLEGAIAAPEIVSLSEMKLFSNDNILDFLKACNVRAVSLANNHITDVSQAFPRTKMLLSENNIALCGAGMNREEAQAPVVIEENGVITVLLAFGWDVIGCKYAGKSTFGVNPLTARNVTSCIEKAKDQYPGAQIIILPHWDYELELYPMPMHRELAKLAIDAGASAVIGHHPHCVQGIEVYKNRLIAYSLGNWFIPDGVYMKGKTSFPDYTRLELALELANKEIVCHWFLYEANDTSLIFLGSEEVSNSQRVRDLTPFNAMSSEDYIKWFTVNRSKRRLLPVFKTDNHIETHLKACFVKMRQKVTDVFLEWA